MLQELERTGSRPVPRCIALLDDRPETWGTRIFGVPVLGPLERAREWKEALFVNGIGSERTYRSRPEIVARTGVPPERFATLVHPTAVVSPTATLGRGAVLFAHVVVGAGARVGDHVLALPQALISHECEVGDHTCIAGGVRLAGRVRVGRCCYLGMGSAVRGGLRIGEGALVGMGAVVVRDVEERAVVVGNPARLLRRIEA